MRTATAWRRTAPPARHLRSARDPVVRICSTVADQKGADQLAPWIQRVYDRFQNQIDIDGVADVSMIPKLAIPTDLSEGAQETIGILRDARLGRFRGEAIRLRKKRGKHLRD
jgi:hypothetical protein